MLSSEAVFFLGAGASKPFGFPLTSEILPKILKEIGTGELFVGFSNAESLARRLNKDLKALLPGLERVSELPLITDVLSLIDYSLLTSTSPLRRRTPADLQRLRSLLEQAIYDVLWWPYTEANIPPLLAHWAQAIFSLAQASQNAPAIISTNYDLSLEHELVRHWKCNHEFFDFGFTWRDTKSGELHNRPALPRLRLYKLHGSVNWLRCDLCDHVYINLRGAIGGYGYSRTKSENNTCHCDHSPLRPVLVTPSMVRDVREVNLMEIWKNSLELLRRAKTWVLIGYSFPSEDIAIKSLFLRALQGRRTRPEITVVQKGDNPSTRARYEVFFPGCTYLTGGLEEYVPILKQNL